MAVKSAVYDYSLYTPDYYLKGFLAGGVCCSVTHGGATIAKFVVQDEVANRIYRGLGAKPSEMSPGKKLGISCTSGFIAGVFAAICSHPADTLFSLMNKPGAGGSGSMYSRMATIAGEMGFYKLATQGLGARCIMIGGLTAGQFAIFDSMLPAIGIDKFHYHEPH